MCMQLLLTGEKKKKKSKTFSYFTGSKLPIVAMFELIMRKY